MGRALRSPLFSPVCLLLLAACQGQPIPDGPGVESVPFFVGRPAEHRPLPSKNVPPHPFLAPNGSMHCDAYNSDADDLPGPLGRNPRIQSNFIGICPVVMFRPDGMVVGVSLAPEVWGMGITAMDPDTLEVIDRYGLPLDLAKFLTGGQGAQGVSVNGGYFHIDHQGRAIVGTQDNRFLTLELADRRWEVRLDVDLSPWVSDKDVLIDTLYDWQGNVWFVSSGAVIGYMDRRDQSIYAVTLAGEFVENGLSVAPDGVFLITSEAAYRFEIDARSRLPVYTWRLPYERGTVAKPGTFAVGSGATPTLLGDDLLAFTNNRETQVDLLVLNRKEHPSGDRQVCKLPLFAPGASAVDVSVIGYGNSIIVENIYNAGSFLGDYRSLAPGLTRIDVREDRSGCDVIWDLDLPSTTVPKLSTRTGLIYTYTQDLSFEDPVDAWFLTAVDFRTGEVVYRVNTGTGMFKNNSFGIVAIGPNSKVYVGTFGGILSVQDEIPTEPEGLQEGNCRDNLDNDGDGLVDSDPECTEDTPAGGSDNGCGCAVFPPDRPQSVFELMATALVYLTPGGLILWLNRRIRHKTRKPRSQDPS